MAEQSETSVGMGAAGGATAGAMLGAPLGPVGMLAGGALGAVGGSLLEGALSPARVAQRREFKKARDRLRTGMGYGFSGAQKQQERTESAQQMAGQLAAQQAGLQRAQAGGMMSGAQATQAAGLQAGAAAAGAAQTERDIQARSQALAMQQHAADQAMIDAQAQRGREASKEMAAAWKKTQSGIPGGMDSVFSSRLSQVAGGGTGAGLPAGG